VLALAALVVDDELARADVSLASMTLVEVTVGRGGSVLPDWSTVSTVVLFTTDWVGVGLTVMVTGGTVVLEDGSWSKPAIWDTTAATAEVLFAEAVLELAETLLELVKEVLELLVSAEDVAVVVVVRVTNPC
jgi:hypothetical protein